MSEQTGQKGVTNVDMASISEADTHFSALLERVPAGEEVIIGMQGKPVAKLVPYHRGHEPRQPGALRGKIIIREDFDELPNDIAEAFGVLRP
ncbi:MAG: type II toxin-antitoxin system prevent-host-death family antitoxin [Pseudomonadota bacterium]